MKKWITCSGLCSRWNINKYDLADIVSSGKLQSFYGEDFSELVIVKDGSIVVSPDGMSSCVNTSPITGDQVTTFIFRSSDVEAYERKNGISPHSTIKKEGGKCTTSEKDSEVFIRSLQVSHVSDTEIKIRGGGKKAIVYGMKELGFKKENSKIWNEFRKILESRDHFYYAGKARGARGARKAPYEVAQKVLRQINEKLVLFLNENYQSQLPEGFKVYELKRDEQPGTYRFKFQIANKSTADIRSFEEFSKAELISQIGYLSEKYRILSNKGDDGAEAKIEKIKDQLSAAMVIACRKEWLTPHRARAYLNPQTDDSLSVENPIEHPINKDPDQEDES